MTEWRRPDVVWPLATAALFVVLSLAGGQVFRAPFDDEIFTLHVLVNQPDLSGVFWFFSMGGDVHPPLPTMLHWLLWHAGLGEVGLRLVSLAMSAAALALAHNLLLRLVPPRPALSDEMQALVAVAMASVPVFLGQGDAIRWYPLFALVFVLALRAMVRDGKLELTPLGGLLAGGLFSVNFLGAPVALALTAAAVWQRGWRRCLPWVSAFVLAGVIGGLSGLPALVANLTLPQHVATQFAVGGGVMSHLRPFAEMDLGLLGGYRIGIGMSWLLVPGAAACMWALWKARQSMLGVVVWANLLAITPMVAVGFNKPRAMMYVGLLMTMVVVQAAMAAKGRERMLLLAGVLVSQLAVVAALQPVGSGFKRNLAIPYPALVESVRGALQDGTPTAVLTTDPVLEWELTKPGAEPLPVGDCVSFYRENAACVAQAAAGARLVTVAGQGAPAEEEQAIAAVTAGREKLGSAVFGYDSEAGLKSRLSGVALGREILVMGVWGR